MCRQTYILDDSEDDRLAALEADLTKEIPDILDAMNRASTDVNMYECQANEAQHRYKECLQQWNRQYQRLRAKHGTAIDCAKPYFDAGLALEIASRRVQSTARKFSAIDSKYAQAQAKLSAISGRSHEQDGFSPAIVRVQYYQEEHCRCEHDHTCALREYQEVKESLDSWRARVSDSNIKRMQPYFEPLQSQQLVMASEQVRITALTRRTQAAKQVYNKSMCQLESINIAVHNAREEHARSPTAVTVAGGEEILIDKLVVEGTGLVRPFSELSTEAPEVTPEPVDVGENEFVPCKVARINEAEEPHFKFSEETPEITPEFVSGQSCGGDA